jgi:hypothetical protein
MGNSCSPKQIHTTISLDSLEDGITVLNLENKPSNLSNLFSNVPNTLNISKQKINKLININHLLQQLENYKKTNLYFVDNPKISYLGITNGSNTTGMVPHTNFQNGTIHVNSESTINTDLMSNSELTVNSELTNSDSTKTEYKYNLLADYDILCYIVIKTNNIKNIEKIICNINDNEFIILPEILQLYSYNVNQQKLIIIDPSILIYNYSVFYLMYINNFDLTVITKNQSESKVYINVSISDTNEQKIISKFNDIKWINLEELVTCNNYLYFTNFDIYTGNIFIKTKYIKNIKITIEINNFKLILNEKMLEIYHKLYNKILYCNELIIIPFIFDPNIKYTKKYIKIESESIDNQSKIIILKDPVEKSSLLYVSSTIFNSQKLFTFDINENILIENLNNFILKELVIFYENIETNAYERISSNFIITFNNIKHEYDELSCDIYSNLYHKSMYDLYIIGFSLCPKENQPSGEITVNNILINNTIKENIDKTKYKMHVILYGYENIGK